MNTEKTGHPLRTLAFVLGGSVLCLLFLAIVYDPVAVVSDAAAAARIRRELPRARERWEASAPDSYQLHVRGAVPLNCLLDVELTVRDGRLSEVRARENPLVPESPLAQVGPEDWEVQGCSFEDLTIERMFLRVDTGLRGIGLLGAPLVVKFDDDRGFITEYRFGRASRGGIFGYTLSECCTWFQFDNFRESPR